MEVKWWDGLEGRAIWSYGVKIWKVNFYVSNLLLLVDFPVVGKEKYLDIWVTLSQEVHPREALVDGLQRLKQLSPYITCTGCYLTLHDCDGEAGQVLVKPDLGSRGHIRRGCKLHTALVRSPSRKHQSYS